MKIVGLLELAWFAATPRTADVGSQPANFTYLSISGARDDGESSGRPDHEEEPHGPIEE